MQTKVKAQLERLQQQSKNALAVLSARIASLRLSGRKSMSDAADAEAPARKQRGASMLRGPWRRKPPGAQPGVVQARKSPRREVPALVVTQPVRLVAASEMVKPFLMIAALAVAVVLSAVTVIFAAYDYRHLFHEHQQLIQQRDDLQVEWGQLLLEQSAWAANNRVEVQAIRKLDMKVPAPEQIEIVRRGN